MHLHGRMELLHASYFTMLCLLLVGVASEVQVEEIKTCEADGQACDTDEVPLEDRGLGLLQVNLNLHTERDVKNPPSGSFALLQTGYVHHTGAHAEHVASTSDAAAKLKDDRLKESRSSGNSNGEHQSSLLESLWHRQSLLGKGRYLSHHMTSMPAIVWIVLIVVLLAALMLFAVLVYGYGSDDRPYGEKHLPINSKLGSKYERMSPQSPERIPNRGSDASRSSVGQPTGSLERLGAPGGPSMPPTSQFPQTASFTDGSELEGMTLPAICPSLILPHTEARFTIPKEQIVQFVSNFQLDINGTSGRKLLNASLVDDPDGRCLSVASCGCEADPRVTVHAAGPQNTFTKSPLTGSTMSGGSAGASGTLEIRGKRPMPGQLGPLYGTLSPAPGGGMVLKHQDTPVMFLQVAHDEDYRMTASSYKGNMLLASAGSNSGGHRRGDGDVWKLQVKPGVDAVLVVSCMLSSIFLCGPGMRFAG